MKCNRVQKYIRLYRDQELNTKELNMLMHHLSVCEKCSQLYFSFRENDAMIARFRHIPVKPDDNEKLTEKIMNSIRDLNCPKNKSLWLLWLNQLADLLTLPVYRRIALITIFFLLTVFGYQQSYIILQTSRLEKQLSSAVVRSTALAGINEWNDCKRKSAIYLLKLSPNQKEMTSALRDELLKDPLTADYYLELFCGRNFKQLQKIWDYSKKNHQAIQYHVSDK